MGQRIASQRFYSWFFPLTLFMLLPLAFLSGKEKSVSQEAFSRSQISFDKAVVDFQKRDFDEALKGLKECLKIVSFHCDALNLQAQVHYLRGEYTQGLERVRMAQELYPRFAGFKINQERVRRENLRKVQESLEVRRNDVLTLIRNPNRCYVPNLQAEIDSIEAELRRITEDLGRPMPTEDKVPADYFYTEGNLLFKLNRRNESADAYGKAIANDNRHEKSYNNLINLLYLEGRCGDLLRVLAEADALQVPVNRLLREAALKRCPPPTEPSREAPSEEKRP